MEAKEDQELNEIILETYQKYRKEPRPKRRFDLEKLTPEGTPQLKDKLFELPSENRL